MLKVNNITALKFSKISFYTFNILVFFFLLVIIAFVSTIPGDAVNGFDLSIGSVITSVVENDVINSTHYNPGVITLYVLLLIPVIGSIVSFLLVKFKFKFETNNYTTMSLTTIALNVVALILVTAVIFTQNISSPIDFSVDQPRYQEIGMIFKYNIHNKIINWERSANGIVFIVFMSFVLFFMFINWLYFSFKIIKHKYIK